MDILNKKICFCCILIMRSDFDGKMFLKSGDEVSGFVEL